MVAMDINPLSIDSLQNDVRKALENKQDVEHWSANESKHTEDACQLLRISDVKKLTTLSKSTIALWVAQQKFPKPLALSATVKVWRLSDITQWVDKRISDAERAS
jgi:prophage regulatory protein